MKGGGWRGPVEGWWVVGGGEDTERGRGVVGKKPFLPKANREGDRFLQLARAQMTTQTTQGHVGRHAADPLFLLIKSPSCTHS